MDRRQSSRGPRQRQRTDDRGPGTGRALHDLAGGQRFITARVLDAIGDKWTVLVISTLGARRLRYSDLLASVPGISQRMLTVTLKALERDGLVVRQAHAEVPPRVEYAVTDLGLSLRGGGAAVRVGGRAPRDRRRRTGRSTTGSGSAAPGRPSRPLGTDPVRTPWWCSSSGTPGHRHVDDAGRGGLGRDREALLDSLEPVPQPFAAAEHDRHDHRCTSSTRSAARNSRTVSTPPPIRTSVPGARSRANASASAGDWSTKWNVVPPSITNGSRGWCVRTTTGVWNGGSSPHHPVQPSSARHRAADRTCSGP